MLIYRLIDKPADPDQASQEDYDFVFGIPHCALPILPYLQLLRQK